MDNLFEQMANITKEHGYDILADQVKELKEENEKLKASNKMLLDALEHIKKMTNSTAIRVKISQVTKQM